MSAPTSPFAHMEQRCNHLIAKYLDPIIAAEQAAVFSGTQVPTPDFDSMAAFRMLSHAELEGYFERKAALAIKQIEDNFVSNKVATSQAASLVFLHLWKTQETPKWSDKIRLSGSDYRAAEISDFKNLAQEALGFGRQFIKSNNGIKDNSVTTLSGLMGYFTDQLDDVLVRELDLYGPKRGDVAHDSWVYNTRTFESAEIEKKRLIDIIDLIKNFYETLPTSTAAITSIAPSVATLPSGASTASA